MTRADDTPVPDYLSLLRLDGRRFVVIGAGQGIGRQTAHALTHAGARLFCVDVDPDLAAEIADEVGGIGWVADATRRDDVERLFAEAEAQLGGIDGIVDIVGVGKFLDFFETPDDVWDWEHDIVLRHAFLAAQIGGRRLVDGGGGVMVFVGSVSGISSAPHHAAYGAAKAGLMSLVRSLAVELGPRGVRVNCIAPGLAWTPRVSGWLGDDGYELNKQNTPIRRVGQTSEMASAILFLASDLASHVSGQTLVVDGAVGVKFPYPTEGQ
jgi:NAD(P)-dependent dehydrogenase (short-subunit alcohol dehydrogenase family)